MPLNKANHIIESLKEKDESITFEGLECWIKEENDYNIYIFSIQFEDKNKLLEMHEELRDYIAIYFQSQFLEKNVERWNIYQFFFIKDRIDEITKQLIEQDKFSTRKIIHDGFNKALNDDDIISAKFQVDHYYPKDDYPFLSISLFNLYPSCATCNNLKKEKEVDFNLYSRDINQISRSNFKFKLSPFSKIKYLTSKDSSDIEILFEEPIPNIGKVKFNDIFHITGIYETQKDLIEELIIKSQIYNDSYLKSLNNSFSKLSLNPSLFKRTIVGNYVDEKDIHKRPMSKVVMDIARELGLIDENSKTI